MGGFWRNEKVRRLSLEARGLLATAWSYSADQATDGKVPIELLRAWSGSKYARLMKELAAFLTIEPHAIDAIAHDWTTHNITVEEWEARLEKERNRKRNGGRDDAAPPGNGGDIPPGNVVDFPTGNPVDFQPGALDEDEDSLRREIRAQARDSPPPSHPKARDPHVAVAQRADVLELHEAWKHALGFPKHRFRSAYDQEAGVLASAIDAYGLADCLLVAKHAPNDGMVSGKRDERGAKHTSIRYIFENNDAFNRILRAAHEAEGKTRRKRSARELYEEACKR